MLLFTATILTAHAGQLAGAVRGADGAGIEGVEVLAINSQMQAAVAETDEYGHYRFYGLPGGPYRLLASPPPGDAHVPRYYPDVPDFCDGQLVSPGTGNRDVDIALPLGHTLSGRVVDLDGGPLSNARVKAASEDGHHTREGYTDTDGYFAVSGLEVDGTWSLSAFVSGHPLQWYGSSYQSDTSTWITTPDTSDIGDWPLLDGIGIAGQITGPDGPVPGALVRTYSSGQISQNTTDIDGMYEAMGLPPGDVTSWASADGYATTYLPDQDRPAHSISVEDEGEWRDGVDITMPVEAILPLQVSGEAPRTQGDLSGLPMVLYNDTQSVGRAAQTDHSGHAEFRGLHPGRYTLYIYGGDAGHSDDWVRDVSGEIRTFTIPTEGAQQTIEVELQGAVTVEGVILDDHGFPIPGAAVVLKDASKADSGEPGTLFLNGTADRDGYFELVGVPQGTWTVTALSQPLCLSDPGHVTVYWPAEVDPVMAEHLTTTLDEPVVSLNLTLPRDGDHDAMGDRWEVRYGLDTSTDDSAEDPDGDGLTNLMEYRLRTDPNSPEVELLIEHQCGCVTGPKSRGAWLPMVLAILVGLRRRSCEASQRILAHHAQ